MYKIIACDLDETLLSTADRKVSAKNVAAVKAARSCGVKFVVATGRGFPSVSGTLDELGLLDLPNEHVISFNGGAITENRGNRLIHCVEMPFATVEKLFKRALAYDVGIHVYTLDKVYGYRFTENERDYLAGRMAVDECDELDINFLRGQRLIKILFVNPNQDYLRRIERELADITADVTVSFSSNRYIEFSPHGVDKGTGLIKLAEILNVKPEETIAIGDNFNDLSMIRAAGLGVGVANCVDGIKQDCNYITAATCDEGAVAEVINKFITEEFK